MTAPIVEFGFGAPATQLRPTWTDCSEYVRVQPEVIATKGRSADAAMSIPVGTAQITLENLDRRFDPMNPATPYVGIDDGCPVRIRTPWAAEPAVSSFGQSSAVTIITDAEARITQLHVAFRVTVNPTGGTVACNLTVIGDTSTILGTWTRLSGTAPWSQISTAGVQIGWGSGVDTSYGTTVMAFTPANPIEADRFELSRSLFSGNGGTGATATITASNVQMVGCVWRGWVESWPQTDQGVDSTVDVSCLDVVGLVAQMDPPESAFAVEVSKLATQPDEWWRPGEGGWVDTIAGRDGRHSTELERLDPLVEGDESTWGQTEPTGEGSATHKDWAIGNSGITVWSMWLRSVHPDGAAYAQGLPLVSGAIDKRYYVLLRAFDDRQSAISVFLADSSGNYRFWEFFGFDNIISGLYYPLLRDGNAHHLMVAVRAPSDVSGGTKGRAWVDGVPLPDRAPDWELSVPPVSSGDISFMYGPGRGFTGALDHVMSWVNSTMTWSQLDQMARSLHDASRGAWAGQRLDERFRSVAAALGVDGLLGSVNTSSIITRHGYRPSNPTELMQKIEDTEQGRVWVDRRGRLRFSARSWAWGSDVRSTVVQAVLSDDPTEVGTIGYLADGFNRVNDSRTLTNVAQVTSEYGRMQTAEDAISIGQRGRRNTVHLSGLMHSTDAESRSIAEWIIFSRSTPSERINAISFMASESPESLALARSIDEGDLLEVHRDGRSTLGHVSMVTHRFTEAGHLVTASLDSTRAGIEWFLADSSLADGTDVAAF